MWWIGVLIVLMSAGCAGFAVAAAPQARPVEGATVVEKPDARVPLDLQFQDEDGKTVRLGDYFQQGRPVLLTMNYYRCPWLCDLTLNGVSEALRAMKLQPGRDFEIVTVGFHHAERPDLARAKKANQLKQLQKLGGPDAASSWHFLSSQGDPAAARALGEAIGFGFKLDPEDRQKIIYNHESAIYLCTPDGRVSRVVRGVQFDPAMLDDSLVNASAGKISRGLAGVAQSCGLLYYDQETGRYVWAAMALMRLTAVTTVVILASVIGTLVWRDRRRQRAQTASGT